MSYYIKGRLHPWKINTCEQCKREFSPTYTNKSQRFCAWECYLESKKIVLVSKLCPVCLKEFKVSIAIQDRYTACSRSCRTKFTVRQDCKRCGKPWYDKKDSRSPYCSEECYRPIHLTTCKHCNKEFRLTPSLGKIFCSRRCYRSYRGENRLEAAVRVALDELNVTYIQEARIGRYRVDFCIADMHLCLEVDTDYWHDAAHDEIRDRALLKYGWKTLRITDREVKAAQNLPQYLTGRLALYRA